MAFPIAAALAIAAEFAPAIAKWLGGPKAGEVAEGIANGAKAITGTDSLEDIAKRLREDAAARSAFQQRMAELEFSYYDADQNDRTSARLRDGEFIKAGRRNWRADILALLAVGGLVLLIWFIARDTDMPERVVNAIMFVAGQFANAVMMVYAFEFGSSRSSKDKDAQIGNILKNGHGG